MILKSIAQIAITTEGWKIDLKTLSFNHNTTKFPLDGQHQAVNCRMCHNSLEFSKAETECISCHTDMHNQTVGPDCARCHTPNSWIVNNITEMHQRSRFPLVGAHVTADCYDCHTNASASLLNFGPLGVECIDCHQTDYDATTNPNHVQGGFSTNCTECHNMTAFSWTGAGINHNFFPLTAGHEINDCSNVILRWKLFKHLSGMYFLPSVKLQWYHKSQSYTVPVFQQPVLIAIPQTRDGNLQNTGNMMQNPFPFIQENTTGTWNNCTECHTNPANYAQFTCIDCHEHNNQSEMNNKHNDVSGIYL